MTAKPPNSLRLPWIVWPLLFIGAGGPVALVMCGTWLVTEHANGLDLIGAPPEAFSGVFTSFGQVATAVLLGIVTGVMGARGHLQKLEQQLLREATRFGWDLQDTSQVWQGVIDQRQQIIKQLCATADCSEQKLMQVCDAARGKVPDGTRQRARSTFLDYELRLSEKDQGQLLRLVGAHRMPNLAHLRDSINQRERKFLGRAGLAVGVAMGLTVTCYWPDPLWTQQMAKWVGLTFDKIAYLYAGIVVVFFTVSLAICAFLVIAPAVEAFAMSCEDSWV